MTVLLLACFARQMYVSACRPKCVDAVVRHFIRRPLYMYVRPNGPSDDPSSAPISLACRDGMYELTNPTFRWMNAQGPYPRRRSTGNSEGRGWHQTIRNLISNSSFLCVITNPIRLLCY